MSDFILTDELKPSITARRRARERTAAKRTAPSQHESRSPACERLIAEHPAASLTVAFSIGVFLGWLIKRR
jgi:ElaB/YqjD/DUF883 family membrane-anchored ribosome-binding protein